MHQFMHTKQLLKLSWVIGILQGTFLKIEVAHELDDMAEHRELTQLVGQVQPFTVDTQAVRTCRTYGRLVVEGLQLCIFNFVIVGS
jgi:hypothetical protein